MNSKISTLDVGPIEAKPFFHFLPGSKVVSVGFYGCNLKCSFCQNSEISHTVHREGIEQEDDKVFALAKRHHAAAIAFTYSEPTIAVHTVMRLAARAKNEKLFALMKTNGIASRSIFSVLLDHLDAVNIDLKGNKEFYRRECSFSLPSRWPMLENMEATLRRGKHLEVSVLISPGCEGWMPLLLKRLHGSVGDETPIHLVKLIPAGNLSLLSPSEGTIDACHKMAQDLFHYVYVQFRGKQSDRLTVCNCGEPAIVRTQKIYVSLKEGRCRACLSMIPGLFTKA